MGALLTGCSAAAFPSGTSSNDDHPQRCVARSSLDSHSTLAKVPLVYEVSGRRSSFTFDPAFYDQLGDWLKGYADRSRLAAPDRVSSYGAWTAAGADCTSWHHAGRAFDLARLRLQGGETVSCRYDQWQSETGARLELTRRRYWALAASLHLDFAYVLTYPYNAQHHNHIHVDNGRSGRGRSTFSTRSVTQVQAVQAICTYLWDEPVELTGAWDSATRRATRRVLDRIGHEADLDASVDGWRALLAASVPRGAH
jgi:hypothetical protein